MLSGTKFICFVMLVLIFFSIPQAVVCSCYIPFYAGIQPPRLRGKVSVRLSHVILLCNLSDFKSTTNFLLTNIICCAMTGFTGSMLIAV